MIKGDSSEYELLIEAVQSSCAVTQDPVLLCEIGVREGLGSKLMLDAALKQYPKVHLLGVDPYEIWIMPTTMITNRIARIIRIR